MHSKGISTNFIAFLNAFSLHKFAVAARKKKARICWLRLKSSSQTFLQLFLKQTLFSKLFSYPRFSRREFYLQTFVCGRINTYSEGFEWNPKVLFGKKDFFLEKDISLKEKARNSRKDTTDSRGILNLSLAKKRPGRGGVRRVDGGNKVF